MLLLAFKGSSDRLRELQKLREIESRDGILVIRQLLRLRRFQRMLRTGTGF